MKIKTVLALLIFFVLSQANDFSIHLSPSIKTHRQFESPKTDVSIFISVRKTTKDLPLDTLQLKISSLHDDSLFYRDSLFFITSQIAAEFEEIYSLSQEQIDGGVLVTVTNSQDSYHFSETILNTYDNTEDRENVHTLHLGNYADTVLTVAVAGHPDITSNEIIIPGVMGLFIVETDPDFPINHPQRGCGLIDFSGYSQWTTDSSDQWENTHIDDIPFSLMQTLEDLYSNEYSEYRNWAEIWGDLDMTYSLYHVGDDTYTPFENSYNWEYRPKLTLYSRSIESGRCARLKIDSIYSRVDTLNLEVAPGVFTVVTTVDSIALRIAVDSSGNGHFKTGNTAIQENQSHYTPKSLVSISNGNIQLTNISGEYTLGIYTAKGRLLRSLSSQEAAHIDVSDLASGIYFYELISASHNSSGHFSLVD